MSVYKKYLMRFRRMSVRAEITFSVNYAFGVESTRWIRLLNGRGPGSVAFTRTLSGPRLNRRGLGEPQRGRPFSKWEIKASYSGGS